MQFSLSRSIVLAMLLIPLGGLTPLHAGSVSHAPTTQSAIDTALFRLADSDAAVREAARVQLMGLSAAELPTLRRAVQAARPLRPGQAEALRDIVTHVYLSGENTDGDPTHGFMGVKMRNDYESVRTGDEDESDLPMGVVVDGRIPGFAAYRSLRDGDIILGIALDGTDGERIHKEQEVVDLVSKLAPGQRVHLTILRGGRRVEVVLTLDARPKELPPMGAIDSFERLKEALQEKAAAYWAQNFAALVDNSIS